MQNVYKQNIVNNFFDACKKDFMNLIILDNRLFINNSLINK
jgi:hypothetical protein